MLAFAFFLFGLLSLMILNAVIERMRYGPYWPDLPPHYLTAYHGYQSLGYRKPSKWIALVMAVLFILLLALTLWLANDPIIVLDLPPTDTPSAQLGAGRL